MESYFDLGRYTRSVTTASSGAQAWFDRGLTWVYGFNHEEAVICFQKAAEIDPDCAMAHWGIAYASGPFYNMPWEWFCAEEKEEATPFCHEAAKRALALSAGCAPVEVALIEAINARFQSPHVVSPEEYTRWDDAYADAMRAVHQAHREDPDVIALCAEALMTRTPWHLWDVWSGEPAGGADTLEALAVLKDGLALIEREGLAQHAGILHMYIHVLEMSTKPEQALVAADRLLDQAPEAGHLQHMPGHIYMICGHYRDAVAVSIKAIAADRKYLAYAGSHNFYTTSCCHDFHLLMYAAMFLGQFAPAQAAAEAIAELLTPELLAVGKPHMAVTLEGYYAMKLHPFVRFGRWREILAEPLPADPKLYRVTTAMARYARTVAHAALGEIAAAELEKAKFYECLAEIPEQRLFFNNLARDILGVAEAMLLGELEYRKGNHEEAFAHLREAVGRNDALHYSEPWAWMHPPRHALGALLLEQGRVEEAEQVYRADLGLDRTLPRCCRHPDNVWALHGLNECLAKRGNVAEATIIGQRLTLALASADVPIAASCCCRGATKAQ